jgi:hypothetical protein
MSVSARELHEQIRYWRNVANDGRGSSMTEALHKACNELDAYASLLAAVESSRHDALVPELRGVADYLSNRTTEYQSVVLAAAARITMDAQEIAALKAKLASVKAHAEAMADAIQFSDMAILTVAKAAAEAYRAAHPKEGA